MDVRVGQYQESWVTKNWCFNINPSNEYSGLIFFRIDWFDLLTVQGGTLKSLLCHHNPKASILWHSAFFMVQLSHLYMTTWKTIAFTIQTFFSKESSLPFIMLYKFVLPSFPSKKQPSFNFMTAVTILSNSGAQANKICHRFHCFPTVLP